jgi:hypothetical protein
MFFYFWEAFEEEGISITLPGWYKSEFIPDPESVDGKDGHTEVYSITSEDIGTFSAVRIAIVDGAHDGFFANFLEQFGREYPAGLYANGDTWRFVGPVDVPPLSDDSNKADKEDTYTKSEVDAKISAAVANISFTAVTSGALNGVTNLNTLTARLNAIFDSSYRISAIDVT